MDIKDSITHIQNEDEFGYELSEKDFYPPEDTRYLKSGVSDINNGDNFNDYSSELFELYDEEEIFD